MIKRAVGQTIRQILLLYIMIGCHTDQFVMLMIRIIVRVFVTDAVSQLL